MSIKKSSVFVIAIIVIVTLFHFITNDGNAMQIDMGEEKISFSGIDDFKYEIAYEDIVALELDEKPDWDALGGHEFGQFRVGETADVNGRQYTLFATTRADNAIVATLADGGQMIFNYNSTYNTEEIYKMLLKNVDR